MCLLSTPPSSGWPAGWTWRRPTPRRRP